MSWGVGVPRGGGDGAVGRAGEARALPFSVSTLVPSLPSLLQAQLGGRPLHHPAPSRQVHLSPCVSVTLAREGLRGESAKGVNPVV